MLILFLSLWLPPPPSSLYTHTVPNHVPDWKINNIFNCICAYLGRANTDILTFIYHGGHGHSACCVDDGKRSQTVFFSVPVFLFFNLSKGEFSASVAHDSNVHDSSSSPLPASAHFTWTNVDIHTTACTHKKRGAPTFQKRRIIFYYTFLTLLLNL